MNVVKLPLPSHMRQTPDSASNVPTYCTMFLFFFFFVENSFSTSGCFLSPTPARSEMSKGDADDNLVEVAMNGCTVPTSYAGAQEEEPTAYAKRVSFEARA